jgi:hypothetical protein
MATSSLVANIDTSATNVSRLVIDRIAASQVTQTISEVISQAEAQRIRYYREDILTLLRNACPNPGKRDKIIFKFRVLAENLQRTRAVAIPLADQFWLDDHGNGLTAAWQSLKHDNIFGNGRSLPTKGPVVQGLFHPLLIALLAYQMGGPVNASLTAQAREWKYPTRSNSEGDSLDVLPHFHNEHASDNILSDHRMTLVWEEIEGQIQGESGSHHVYLGQDPEASLLPKATLLESRASSVLSTILYESKDVSIMHECLEDNIIRHSISLDFHRHAIDDEVHRLVSEPAQIGVTNTNLGKLLLGCSFPQYDERFRKLVFGGKALQAIIDKLSSLGMDTSSKSPPLPNQKACKRWVDDYDIENRTAIPQDIRHLEDDVCIAGTCYTNISFMNMLILKARRDVHLPIGADLIPLSSIEDNRESARKYIRNMSSGLVKHRIEQYADVISRPYSHQDLMTTNDMQAWASFIETIALNTVGLGFVDESSVLVALPAFVSTLGNALNGPKEIEMSPDPTITEKDTQIYRSRCLYLFWCAEWLVGYLGRPVPGPFMLDEADTKVVQMRGQMALMAEHLLRNWVAWGLLVEKFQSGSQVAWSSNNKRQRVR